MKKIYLSTILMLAISPATASFFYYGGAAGGMVNNSGDVDQDVQATAQFLDNLPVTTSLPKSGNLKESTVAGQLQLGAGFKYHYFYLAAEISGQFSDGDIGEMEPFISLLLQPQTFIKQKIDAKFNSFELAVDLKPGISLSSKTLVYGRVGAAFNEIEINQSLSDISPDFGINANFNSHNSKNVTGLRLGLGVEHNITNQLRIFLDYVYTQYPNISTNSSGSVTGSIFPIVENFTLDTDLTGINKQAVMLGLNYYMY